MLWCICVHFAYFLVINIKVFLVRSNSLAILPAYISPAHSVWMMRNLTEILPYSYLTLEFRVLPCCIWRSMQISVYQQVLKCAFPPPGSAYASTAREIVFISE